MQNRPLNLLGPSGAVRPSGMWQVEQNPAGRLIWLFLVFLLASGVIVTRLAYVQFCLIDRFVLPSEQRFESFEALPCRDGSILAADLSVLAEDLERFQIRMHYRWLEDPADPHWLRSRAVERLSRDQRRDRVLIEQAEAQVLAERAAMWERLAALIDVSREELAERQRRIQDRVERMLADVEQRRDARIAQSTLEAREAFTDDDPFWKRWWSRLLHALSTSPEREREPMILPEQSDYYVVADGLDLRLAAQIKDQPHLFPGLDLQLTTQRVYPAGAVACHVVGTRTPLEARELDERRKAFPDGDPLGYRSGDRIGRTGVERSYDRALRGVPGLRRVVRNRRGEILETQIVRAPRNGKDVELTLSLPLQQDCERLLDRALGETPDALEGDTEAPPPKRAARGGAIVVMKIGTGAVLAAAAAPRFNLNLFSEFDQDLWDRTLADPRRPMFPRVTNMAIAPGSVFKVLTALALLGDPNFNPDAAVNCRGYLDNPHSHRCYIFTHYGVGHGEVTLADALTQSCNVYFFDNARRYGPELLVKWARRFGFGQPTGIDLPGESGGNVPSPDRPDTPWYPGDTLGLAIGQSRLTVTPLQIVRMMAAVANGGRLVVPHVARTAHESAWGDTAAFEPEYLPELGETTLGRVQDALTQVVANRRGTGYKYVRLAGVNIAGKTGTAETGRGDHAWFAGFVPADAPKYAFVVVLEHGGGGGAVAGPVAKQVVKSLDDMGLLGTPRLSQRAE